MRKHTTKTQIPGAAGSERGLHPVRGPSRICDMDIATPFFESFSESNRRAFLHSFCDQCVILCDAHDGVVARRYDMIRSPEDMKLTSGVPFWSTHGSPSCTFWVHGRKVCFSTLRLSPNLFLKLLGLNYMILDTHITGKWKMQMSRSWSGKRESSVS